ncbi:unnamed protein product [Prunus armeniaca]|uniref:Uncharacterized protein n=1 Tax=Prunus armeniaca TaxID=36596 RepID=A0A6J5TMW1_PRUAR|nr:unnamed protein product [Prunus armeniaca]
MLVQKVLLTACRLVFLGSLSVSGLELAPSSAATSSSPCSMILSPDTAHSNLLDLESARPSSHPAPPQLPSYSSRPPTDLLSPFHSISPASILTCTRNPTLAICTFPSPSTTPPSSHSHLALDSASSSNAPPGTSSPPTLVSALPPSKVTRAMNGIQKPNPKYALIYDVNNLSVETSCYSQAHKFPEWCQAMTEECTALQLTGTWILVPYHSLMNVLLHQRTVRWYYRAL